MKKRIFNSFLLAVIAVSARASESIWECDLGKADISKWKLNNISFEKADQSLRIKIAGNPSNYGTFYHYVPSGGPEYYLQVKMGQIEDSKANPGVTNLSSGGKYFGSLHSGWNTFSMMNVQQKNFALAFVQAGSKGQPVGPWVDYSLARITQVPLNGLTVTLESGDGTAKVGDSLIFRYYPTGPLMEKTLEARCFTAKNFVEFNFSKKNLIRLESANGIYEKKIEITADAMGIKSDSTDALTAMVKVNGESSYFTLPFKLDIQTANPIPSALVTAATPQVRDDRRLWFDRTRGVNLALGKKVLMYPPPDYALTKDENDAFNLTDGKLTERNDDKIWFDRSAVGWIENGNDRFLKISLGEMQPVGKLVIRCLGGSSLHYRFPNQFELYVSKDDDKFYNCASMEKVLLSESSQSDFEKFYYLEEEGGYHSTRMYPFELKVNADARHLLLKITGETGFFFTDELAVIKAEKKDSDYNRAYENPGKVIPMSGMVIRPRVEELAMIVDLPAPQKFVIQDMRAAEEKGKPVEMVVELPTWAQIVKSNGKYEKNAAGAKDYDRYVFPLKETGGKFSSPTIYLALNGSADDKPAFTYARLDGKDHYKSELPLKVVKLPEIKPFERLHISLSWMTEGAAMSWPDFLTNWRKLGFNNVSSFPRYWYAGKNEEIPKFLERARTEGFKVIMNECPFHVMLAKNKNKAEIYCRLPDAKTKAPCPSYRGEYYRKEMERITLCTKVSKPDYVFYDIEFWHRSKATAAKCTRCQEALAKSGKTFEEFIFDCGTETVRDAKAAVKAGAEQAGIPMPVIGSYDRKPLRPDYAIEKFDLIYPEYIDMAQPSLYVSGRAYAVHDNIRGNYRLMKNKKIIPWLTTGCYGEFESYKVEPMVLEALLNGAGGVTYFQYNNFTDSPLDFYYHALALSYIRPYEDLIADGEVLEPEGSNDRHLYSAVRKGDEMLLLAGNYRRDPEATTVKLPFRKINKITDLCSGQEIKGGVDFQFDVPKGGIRLFHITGD